jgi:uncharacterized protein (DUF1015 family)
MYFINFPSDIVTSLSEINIDFLKCHEEVVESRLNSFLNYLQALEGDILVSSIIVCSETHIIIDGHHRYHALKKLGLSKVPVTFVNYQSESIKAYFDDRLLKNDIIEIVKKGNLLPPKSSKHVIWDERKKVYMPILMLSCIWSFNLNDIP